MKLKVAKILDFLFVMFVFSSICMSSSQIGKMLQLFSTILILALTLLNKPKITFFNILEFLFVFYAFLQVFFDIVEMKSASLQAVITIFYNVIFLLAIINYLIYRKDDKKIINLYAITTLVCLVILAILNYHSILSYRFNSRSIFSILNIKLIGGHSSTSLAIIAAIPSFFLILLSEKQELRKNVIISSLLMFFAILTGTRKTLLIFLLTFLVTLPLNNNKISIVNLLKLIFRIVIVMVPMIFIIFKVPFIYNRIGTRIENVIYIIKNSENNDDASIRDRNRMIIRAEQLYKKRPIYGWGMDYFRASRQNNLGYYSHNNFLELLSGAGIVGFVIYYLKYLFLMLLIFRMMFKDKEKRTVWFNCLWFLMCMTIIEYWQVTYIYRFIIIYQGIIIAMIYNRCRVLGMKLLI